MYRFLVIRRLFSWFAILAILGASAVSTVSYALIKEKTNAASWLEICSAKETKFLLASKGNEKDQTAYPAQHSLHFEHCPFCVIHVAGMPPDQKHHFLFLLAQENLYPPLLFSVPQLLFLWSVANPRAPPIVI